MSSTGTLMDSSGKWRDSIPTKVVRKFADKRGMDKKSLKSGLIVLLFPCLAIASVMVWSAYDPEYQPGKHKEIVESVKKQRSISSVKHP